MAGKTAKHVQTVDAEDFWRRGALGFLVRYRNIAITAVTKSVLAGLAFWYVNWVLGVGFLICVVSWVIMLLYLRVRFLRRTKADSQLHSFFHEMRDELPKISGSGSERAKKVEQLNRELVQQIAAYFRALKGDPTINCALRIADNKRQFVTRARSDGFDKSRKSRSQPIPEDKGLANALRSNDASGVYLIHSIEAAKDLGIWMDTPTDRLPDVVTLMVAPVNTIEAGRKAMIGILHITSQKHVFSECDTLAVKAFADALGTALALATQEPCPSNIILGA